MCFWDWCSCHQYLQPADKEGRRLVGNLRGVKAAAVCIGRTALLWGARVRERCDGHCGLRSAVSWRDFWRKCGMKRKYKALRVCGLVLVLLCVVKLVLVDIRYDNVLLRAAGFLSEASFALVSVLYTIWSTSGWGGAKMQKTEKIPCNSRFHRVYYALL